MTNELGCAALQQLLQTHLDTQEHKQNEQAYLQTLPRKLRNEGLETVNVTIGCGLTIQLRLRYYRQRQHRRANKRHKGVYPAMIMLGLQDHVTPQLGAQVSCWCALLSSFAEVRQVLQEQAIDLDVKALRRISYACAERARCYQESASMVDLLGSDTSSPGRRIVISTDGGRVRLRENKRGPKTKKGRTRFHAQWREPKLMIIYMVDEQGKQTRHQVPFIDSCMQGPDAIFERIQCYLNAMQINQDDSILLIADGAPWIWSRFEQLMQDLNNLTSKVYQLIDFYHAAQHLNSIAVLKKQWKADERRKWVNKQKRRLLKGKPDLVIEDIKQICKGRLSKAIKTERDYFIRHQHRMNYAQMRALALPIGSGAVESSIRRVINLRVKGPGIYWHKENVEHILMLRSFYKAKQWKLLKKMAYSTLTFSIE